MKRIIQLYSSLLVGFLIHLTAFTQDFPCVNNISTNPLAPVNDQIYDVRPELINTFDWGKIIYNGGLPVAINFYPIHDMASAFQSSMTNPYHYQNPYGYLVSGSVEDLDFHWEDGWELLSFNLGYYPNEALIEDVTDGNDDPINQEMPYVIFYNRYRSIIRVFFNSLTGLTNNTYKGVTITLKFVENPDNNVSGTFMPSREALNGLDKRTEVTAVKNYSDHPNVATRWCHADFQVGYDPCVCIYRSDIDVDFAFIQSSDLKMVKREITLEKDLINSDGSINYDSLFLGNIFFNEFNEATAGAALYNDMGVLIDKYKRELEKVKRYNAAAEEHNKKIEKWKWLFDLAKNGVTVDLPNLIKDAGVGDWGADLISSVSGKQIFGYTDTEIIYDDNGYPIDTISRFVDTLTVYNDTLVSGKIVNGWIKDGIKSGFDKFSGEMFKEKSLLTKPKVPTAMFSEATYRGKITTVTEVEGTKFYNPGSFKVGDPNHWSYGKPIDAFNYPYYNETMGLFALLETPKIDFYTYEGNEVVNIDALEAQPYGQNVDPIEIERKQKKAIKLNRPLKYHFNPALDIKEYDIQAAWVIKLNRKELSPKYGCKKADHYAKVKQVNMNSLDVDEQSSKLGDINKEYEAIDYLTFTSTLVPLENLYDFRSEIHLVDELKQYKDWYGLGNIQNYVFDKLEYQNWLDYEVTVQLKLLVDVTFDNIGSDGEPYRHLLLQTYAIEEGDMTLIDDESIYNNSDEDIAYNLNDIPQFLSFGATAFEDGKEVKGCIKRDDANEYTCRAWEKINIWGEIEIESGTEVRFIAGKEIEVAPDASVDDEAELTIIPLLEKTPMPIATSDFVQEFCQENTDKPYQAFATKDRGIHDTEEQEPKPRKTEIKIGLGLYPNPAEHWVTVNYILDDNATTTVYISDITGKKVMDVQESKTVTSGLYRIPIDVSSLSSGVYFCTITANGQQKTEKLVIR